MVRWRLGGTCKYSTLGLLVHCYLSLQVTQVLSKYIQGVLDTTENWAFITRFCFFSKVGTFQYLVQYPVDYAVENILLYYDEPSQWNAVYKQNKTCEQKESVLSIKDGQIHNLTRWSTRWNSSFSCTIELPDTDNPFYRCYSGVYFISARERWWYIALSNCKSTKGLKLEYKIKMLNGDEHNYWTAHFSADEFYILHTDIVFLVIYVLLLGISSYAASILRSRKLFHTTYKLYLTSVCSQLLGLLLLVIAYDRYARNGVGLPSTKLWGQIFLAFSTLLLLMLVLLIAKGYTVTRGRLRKTSSVRLFTFVSVYCFTYVVLFIYQQEVFDPGTVLYLYESPAGYGIVVLRLVGWGIFIYAIVFTLKHHPEKGAFYFEFFVLYSSWFLTGPIVIIISNNLIDKWVREKVVNGVELFVTLFGHSIFLFLTRPSAANQNFPFHVRTTQIHAMEHSPDEIVGNCRLDNFSRNFYEVPKHVINNNIINSVVLVDSSFSQAQQSTMVQEQQQERLDQLGNNVVVEMAVPTAPSVTVQQNGHYSPSQPYPVIIDEEIPHVQQSNEVVITHTKTV